MGMNDYFADKFCRTIMIADKDNNPDANKKCAFPMGTLINQGIQDRCTPSIHDKTVFECPTVGYDKKKHSVKDFLDIGFGMVCPYFFAKLATWHLAFVFSMHHRSINSYSD